MAAKQVQAEIVRPEFEVLDITIEGTSPLIVHNFSEKARRQMLEAQQQKATSKKKHHDPKVPFNDFMGALYWLTPKPEDGIDDDDAKANYAEATKNGCHFGFRADGIKASAISGAYRSGFTKDKVSIQGAFHLYGATEYSTKELAEIVGSEPWCREDIVKIGQGTADLRYRPQFDEWEIPLKLEYNKHGMYSLDQILTFIETGGFTVGLGEWRVEKGGLFGSYRLKA